MEEADAEHDAPTSDPTQSVGAAATAAMGQSGMASDSEDEAAPDFGPLAALARKRKLDLGDEADRPGSTLTVSLPAIPKRGEKDFEPTGFAGQNKALENSRSAMFEVISSERVINSKSISIATWEPKLNRAIVQLARGQAFTSMGVSRRVAVLEDGQFEDLARLTAVGQETLPPVAGVTKDGIFWPKVQSRVELLPEEALFLVERGSLECRARIRDVKGTMKDSNITVHQVDMRDYDDEAQGKAAWVPLSVEQAFAAMIGADGLTRPRFQLYAHLKRLGYIVQRKSISDTLRSAVNKGSGKQTNDEGPTHATGVVADRRHPLPLVSIFDVLLYPLRRIVQLSGQAVSYLGRVLLPQLLDWMRNITRRSSFMRSGSSESIITRRPGLLGIGTAKWTSYDQIYDRLRIVPTDHDTSLRGRESSANQDEAPEIFFYAWRPATHFKKSEPPLPEYQLAVVDARSTSLPSAFAFSHMFDHVPLPLSTQEWEQLDDDEKEDFRRAAEQKKRNDESYGRGAVRKREAAAKEQAKADAAAKESPRESASLNSRRSFWQRFATLFDFLKRLLQHLPLLTHRKASSSIGGRRMSTKVNVYVPLKAGRRNVIVAVNDCGTTSLLRFGEAEFARWRIAGSGREGH